jgi:discoidin domain receptor family protein 2
VQVFSHAKVHFSIGGHQFVGEPVLFSYMPDVIMEHARNVTIKLHNRVGRYLRLQLYFAAKWIMVSEVSFDSGESAHILSARMSNRVAMRSP